MMHVAGGAKGADDRARGLPDDARTQPPVDRCAEAWLSAYDQAFPRTPAPKPANVANARAVKITGAVISVLGTVGLLVGGIAIGILATSPGTDYCYLECFIPAIAVPIGAIEFVVGLPMLIAGIVNQARAEDENEEHRRRRATGHLLGVAPLWLRHGSQTDGFGVSLGGGW